MTRHLEDHHAHDNFNNAVAGAIERNLAAEYVESMKKEERLMGIESDIRELRQLVKESK